MDNQDLDRPRSLGLKEERKRRHELLSLPHVAPLAAWVHQLRLRGLGEIPHFDPLDGGVNAQALFLFEKPGPMTSENSLRLGSGFISRNNDDPTAEATFKFMEQAMLPREMTVTWNVIPGWNGTRKVNPSELRTGLLCVNELTSLLPSLKVVVLVGTNASKAKKVLEERGYAVLTSDHPSPIVRASRRERWEAIPEQWSKVVEHCTF